MAQLVAPRPLRLSAADHFHFFLSNPIAASGSVLPSAFVGEPGSAHGATHQDPNVLAPSPNNTAKSAHVVNEDNQEVTIEDMAARICLDDEVDCVTASKGPLVEIEKAICSPNRTTLAEEIAIMAPRSPEAAAALDEFLSILRPVIRAPASPIARSKRLVPRSRHAHHHAGLHVTTGPNQDRDRHHPYARATKSTSPLERIEGSDSGGSLIGVSAKRVSARSPTSLVARRRSSNANDSSYSCGSASMCSSRSQSISRRGSDGYLNAWTAASPPSATSMDMNPDMDAFNASGQGVASLLLLSGMSPHGSSPTHEYHE